MLRDIDAIQPWNRRRLEACVFSIPRKSFQSHETMFGTLKLLIACCLLARSGQANPLLVRD